MLEGLRLSPVYETEPMGEAYAGQRPFLNLCCVGETSLGPRPLLDRLLGLESEAGRTRPEGGGGARTLDVDLLLYGGRVIDEPGLRVPHPRMAGRAFVLVPLADVAPEWRHPVVGEPVRALAGRVDAGGVRRYRGDLPEVLRRGAAREP